MSSHSQVTNLDLEEEPLDRKPYSPAPKRRRCLIALGVVLVLIFLLFLTGLILALTVFKVHRVDTRLVSATLDGVSPLLTLPILTLQLNVTVSLQIEINNRNYASFRHAEGRSLLIYEGVQVGDAVIDAGTIRARGRTVIAYRLRLQVDKVAGKVDGLLRDVGDGDLVLQARTRIPGTVKIMGVIKRDAVAVSECELGMNVMEMKVTRQVCKQRTEL